MTESSGLKTTSGAPVPLLGVEAKAEVLGSHARVLVRQRYRNVETRPIEAVYVFPLPADGTLSGFAMVCEGRRLEGVVREREQAFRDYDDAIFHGHGAALLEQERANVFTATVGNLLPNEETLIEVEYLQRLHADEGALRFAFPTLVAPRYIPGAQQGDRTGGGWAEPTDAVPDADRITPRIGDVKYGLALELSFAVGDELAVESPSHAISVEKRDGRTIVRFAQREVALDRDVVVTARNVRSGPIAGVVAHRTQGKPGTFALTVVPDLFDGASAKPQRVVFLVDTSGSMGGASIVEAKAALRLCLRQLRAGDTFDLIEFNSSWSAFAHGPTTFDESGLARADRWVAGLAPTGGTELLSPLVEAVRRAGDGIVVLLTDGQVGNERQILDAVLQARKNTRIYSFGIGTNVSDALLRDLSKHTGGAVEFIHPGERIDDKVVATFAKALARRVENVSVTLRGLEAGETAPEARPPLIDGEPWALFGRYVAPGAGTVELRGTLDGKPWSLDMPITLPEEASHPGLEKLWASERIRDLEGVEVTGRRAGLMKERIVKLAVEFGVSSPYTSFLVVEERTGARLAIGQPETRFVPVNAPAGWDMFQQKPQPVSGGMAPMGASYGMPAPSMAPPSMPRPSAPMRSRASAPPSPVVPPPGIGRAAAELAKKAKKLFKGNKEEGGAPPPPAARSAPVFADMAMDDAELEAAPSMPAPGGKGLLERQLASGLWAGKDDAGTLRATTDALLALADEGITTSHALYGAQVRKAVEALVQLARKLATAEASLVERALGAAWLVATGARTKSLVEGALKDVAPTGAIVAKLGDVASVRTALRAG